MSNEGNKDPSIKTLQSISSSIAAIETPLLQQMRLQLVLDALKKEATDSTKAAWYAEVQYIHHYTYNKLIETSTLKATYAQLVELIASNIEMLKRDVTVILRNIVIEFKSLGYDLSLCDAASKPTAVAAPLEDTHKVTAVHIGDSQDLEPADNPKCNVCNNTLSPLTHEYWQCGNPKCILYAVPIIVAGIQPVIASNEADGV